MWIAKIAVRFFPLMHAGLISRPNVANSKKLQPTKILQIKFMTWQKYTICELCA